MKNLNLLVLCTSALVGPLLLPAQPVATFHFNNTNFGVPGLNNLISVADFSPAIPVRAYNSTVYYGEGGWPGGALDVNSYLAFTIWPVTGYSLGVSNVLLTIRRSTTGSAGAGPTRWALRSSLDGFTTDLGSGTLNTNPTNFTIPMTPSFLGLVLPTTYRIYGYQSVISPGGLNRMVFEHLVVNGTGIVLPVRIGTLQGSLQGNQARIQYHIDDHEPGNRYELQRSLDGTLFQTIEDLRPGNVPPAFDHQYSDDLQQFNAPDFYYRLRVTDRVGHVSYSRVCVIAQPQKPVAIRVWRTSTGLRILNPDRELRRAEIFDEGGRLVAQYPIDQNSPSSDLTLPGGISGIYLIRLLGLGKQSVQRVRL